MSLSEPLPLSVEKADLESPEDQGSAQDRKSAQDPAVGPAGKVVSIGRIVDPQTGNLPVRVLVDNADGRLAVGQTLAVAIEVHERAGALTVPSIALVDLGEGPLVVVVRDGRVVQLHPTSVSTHGKWTVVSGTDLRAGEPVVVEGGFNLPEGTPVMLETGDRARVAERKR